MEKYRFTLDGTTLIRNPENWEDIKITLERQEDIQGLLLIFTSELTFIKDGYDLLNEKFVVNYNDKITANIDVLNDSGNYDRLFTGLILLSDILFNLNKRTARVKLQDISFFGAIDNNKNIKTFLNSEFTKNGVQITTPTAFQLDYFTPATGVFFGFGNRDHYLVSDALDFLVRFMTDDVVKGVVSTYLTTPSNFEGGLLYVTTGEEIRTGIGQHPNISFKGLFQFLQRTHNISFVIETDSNGDPVMRIEEKEFFFETDTSFTIRNIQDLELKVDRSKLFSHLGVGNNIFEKSGNFSTTTRFFSFRDEDYLIEGFSNVDKALDLKTDYITDNNVIEKIVVVNIGTADDEFDEDTIIVTGNTAGTLTSKFGTPDFHYNKGLTNDQVILRQINSIPLSISKYLSAQITPCFAFKSNTSSFNLVGAIPSIIVLVTVVDFDDDSTFPGFDLGANFNAAVPNHYYEIPFNGVFTFRSRVRVGVLLPGGVTSRTIAFRGRVEIQRWNAGLSVIQESQELFGTQVSLTATTLDVQGFSAPDLTVSMTCSTGERIRVRSSIQIVSENLTPTDAVTVTVVKDSTIFKCLGADNDAGVYEYFQPENYRVLTYRFQKNTNFTDFNTLISQSLRRIKFNEGSDPALDKLAWIDKIDYKVETSETDYQLIT
ncbi:hypothetical protein LCGC14_0463960 [marine sediment metagenome]|uniref:Uncharacterized protein n=1 Tax=marine sediment metagenome TaxID=412755 RepID=A0A0F9VN46_9ZZZZ